MEFRIKYFPELASTNDEASSAYVGGDVIVCGSQTKGKGQRGNGWHSSPGCNLTFSVVVEPRFLPAAEQFLLSMAVSLSVTDTLQKYGIKGLIKWPNDIYVGERKISGILIENDICGANLSRSVIGIGLNVNETGFPKFLPNPVSMAEISGGEFNLDDLLSEFLTSFAERYALLEQGYTDALISDYDALIYRKGTSSMFRRPSGELFEGTISKVMPNGLLIVDTGKGREEFLFKEIEFVI